MLCFYVSIQHSYFSHIVSLIAKCSELNIHSEKLEIQLIYILRHEYIVHYVVCYLHIWLIRKLRIWLPLSKKEKKKSQTWMSVTNMNIILVLIIYLDWFDRLHSYRKMSSTLISYQLTLWLDLLQKDYLNGSILGCSFCTLSYERVRT